MSKKQTIVIISVIVILIVFTMSLGLYVAFTAKEKSFFSAIAVGNSKKDVALNNTIDKEVYKNNIIEEPLLTMEYSFYDSKESITGNIYIGRDNYLYITDLNRNMTHRVSTIKFKTMYAKEWHFDDGVYIYLIAQNNTLYYMSLTSNDIRKATVEKSYTTLKATHFVNLKFKTDIYNSSNMMFVLANDGYIYDVGSKIRYTKEIISLYNNIYVYEDKTIANAWGEMLQDANGNYYKIRYVFLTKEKNNFLDKDKIVIITEDSKFIYIDRNVSEVYEFSKKVKDIKFDKNMPYIEGNLEITFEDNDKVDLKATSNEYFSLNKFNIKFE